MTEKNLWLRLQRVSRDWGFLIKALAVGVAASWTLWQYYEHKQEERVQAVLDYRKELRSEPLYSAWRNMAIVGIEQSDVREQAHTKGGQAWIEYVIALANSKDIYPDFQTVITFYDDLQNCEESEICDRDTTESLFGAEAVNIYDNYVVYIDCYRLKHNDQTYGLGLTSLAIDFFENTHHRKARITNFTFKQCENA